MKTITNAPEIKPERLEELVKELIRAGALAGPITTSGGRRTKGLAFILEDMTSARLKKLLGRFDLTLPLSPKGLETLAALKDIVAQNRGLTELSVRDNLTGLYNFRYFQDRLRVEMERVRRTEHPCSLLMIDLDKFKPVNDTYGHQTGDEVLRYAADIIQAGVRTVDIAVRYGGDEFAVILPDTGTRPALRLAERIREHLALDPRTSKYGVTGSLGLSTHHHFDGGGMEDLIERADQSMYQAKRDGGNHVRVFESDRLREAWTEVTPAEKEALFFRFKKP